MAVTTGPFGVIAGRDQVAQQVISLLQTPPAGSGWPLIVYYLAEVERQEGLVPQTIPVPESNVSSFRTGLDFERFTSDQLPTIIAVAQPSGAAERYQMGAYGQWYEVQIAAIYQDSGGDEVAAQQMADRYGSAIMACVAQNGALGGPTAFTVDKTVIMSAPRTEFIQGAPRSICQSIVTVSTFVQQVAQEQGPNVFGPNPYVAPAAWPTAATVKTQLQSENAAGAFSTPTGVQVVLPFQGGQVVVTE